MLGKEAELEQGRLPSDGSMVRGTDKVTLINLLDMRGKGSGT